MCSLRPIHELWIILFPVSQMCCEGEMWLRTMFALANLGLALGPQTPFQKAFQKATDILGPRSSLLLSVELLIGGFLKGQRRSPR